MSTIPTSKDYVLTLKVHEITKNLIIYFTKKELTEIKEFKLGEIDNNGRCYILDNDEKIKNWEEWRYNGFKLDSRLRMKWRDGIYCLNNYCLKRIDISNNQNIYSFYYCIPSVGCEDKNIKKFSNKTPIIY